ncbi:hypothetical protein [Thalassomonas sp. RHCl1]|uniref:hypothetical protein n=1 Tax=Thalassomonas sp. RHCl1 TaxID=2995320 RepID=UPI00248BFE01|nr:hypothetical protein [Thalassomonas sp. RHCl1]
MDKTDDQSKKSRANLSEKFSPYQSLMAILLISMLVFASVLLYPSKISEQFNFPSLSLWQYNSETSLLPKPSGEKVAKDKLEPSSFMTSEQVNLGQLLLELANAKNSGTSTSYNQAMGQGA